MIEHLLGFLRDHEGPDTYAVIALASAAEYVVPVVPGDTLTLFAVFLAVTAGYTPWLVFLCLCAGSTAGGFAAYGFGRFLGEHEQGWPRILRGPRTRAAIAAVRRQFARHGGAYLVVNRFLPAFRAIFFVAAGIARVPPWKVAVFGGASAVVWNGLLFLAGYSAGNNWERLESWIMRYAQAALLVALVAVLFVVGVHALRNRARRHNQGKTGGSTRFKGDGP